MTNILLFIGGPEIFIVLVVVLVLFGSKRIPELARGLGKGMQEFKKATTEIKRELSESTGDIKGEIDELKEDIDDIKRDVNKL